MIVPCGCCQGIQSATPQSTANRPGLPALAYRVGTHNTFLETMLARLSNSEFPELAKLRSRETRDPSIALLDGCATMLDVLAFYQERLANEGYLRTARERRSVLELARLIGYQLRPGVSASVFLAFEIDPNQKDTVVISVGSPVQSVPGPGETAQTFETSEALRARAEWNSLKPRMTRPQLVQRSEALTIDRLYVKGMGFDLKPNDPLLLVFGDTYHDRVLRRIQKSTYRQILDITEVRLVPTLRESQMVVELIRQFTAQLQQLQKDNPENGTVISLLEKFRQYEEVSLLSPDFASESGLPNDLLTDLRILEETSAVKEAGENVTNLLEKFRGGLENVKIAPAQESSGPKPIRSWESLITPLLKKPSEQPTNRLHLIRTTDLAFSKGTLEARNDTIPQLMIHFKPKLQDSLYASLANAHVTDSQSPLTLKEVYQFHISAAPFGANAPVRMHLDGNQNLVPAAEDWTVDPEEAATTGESSKQILLDQAYDVIYPNSYIIIQKNIIQNVFGTEDVKPFRVLTATTVKAVTVRPRTAYGISGKTTVLQLADSWPINLTDSWPMNFAHSPKKNLPHRSTSVFAGSQPLELSERPLEDDVEGSGIELAGIYDGLESGRWIIVSGERKDISGTSGITGVELMMLEGVTQQFDPTLPGDKIHTVLTLAGEGLKFTYKRDTTTILGNVVKATHGETRAEILGSGDPAQTFQTFTLKQPPLTYVSAPTRDGIQSTLTVRVNDVAWPQAQALSSPDPFRRSFMTQTDDEGKTSVSFGAGTRLPSGMQNVRASYRNGLGKTGNVNADQLTLLATRPLGVKGVTNPIRASGGADKESRDQAKQTAPLAVLSLDRLVSIQDYADFSRTFAGIGKAHAMRLSNGTRQIIHVTIAGVEDIPIEEHSDLLRNLRKALRELGDLSLPIEIEVRELLALIVSADVAIEPEYEWESVVIRLRAALLEAFGFERRDLGQSVPASQVLNVIQQVPGVRYVDLNVFSSLSEMDLLDEERLQIKLDELGKRRRPNAEQFDGVVAGLARFDATQRDADARTVPAQLAMLVSSVPDTLILNLRG